MPVKIIMQVSEDLRGANIKYLMPEVDPVLKLGNYKAKT